MSLSHCCGYGVAATRFPVKEKSGVQISLATLTGLRVTKSGLTQARNPCWKPQEQTFDMGDLICLRDCRQRTEDGCSRRQTGEAWLRSEW